MDTRLVDLTSFLRTANTVHIVERDAKSFRHRERLFRKEKPTFDYIEQRIEKNQIKILLASKTNEAMTLLLYWCSIQSHLLYNVFTFVSFDHLSSKDRNTIHATYVSRHPLVPLVIFGIISTKNKYKNLQNLISVRGQLSQKQKKYWQMPEGGGGGIGPS